MIISFRSKSYEDLKKQLVKEDKIVIISCNTCVVACGVGGMQAMQTLEQMLKADGYKVVGKDLISIACTLTLVENHRADAKKKEMYDESTVIIPLVCENGLQCVNQVFADKKILTVLSTVGTGNFTMDNGVVLTHPFESTGLSSSDEGYPLSEVAEKLGFFPDFFDEDEAASPDKTYVNLTIDGQAVTAEKGQNLLQVCQENGIEVPHLCYHEELSEAGVCRLCLVKIEGRKDLIPSCCTHVDEGMVIVTEDEELIECRRVILELVLASHNHSCLTCSKGVANIFTSCELQAMVRKYGVDTTRYDENKETLPIDTSSPVISYDQNKCILCGRCVRACEEIAGMRNLGFAHRGSNTVVVAGLNQIMDQSDCVACMACVNVCPTGSLSERYLHFEGADWKQTKIYSDCL
jgi:formate hydrogenlyase subunit 6/NADH:ubiquinone oxidoreductase subunit I